MWFQVQKDLQENTEDKRKTKSKKTMGLNVDRSLFFFFATTLLHKTESLKKNLIFFPNRKPSTKLNKSIFCVFTDERKGLENFFFQQKKKLNYSDVICPSCDC